MFLTKKYFFIGIFVLFFFIIKISINNLLLAENGDTYDFFRIAYEFRQDNYLVESKRMPLFPFFLSLTSPVNFVIWGRVLNNLLYFGLFIIVFKIVKSIFKISNKQAVFYTLLFGSFYPVLDNSFFIMSDTLFLLLVLIFFYLNIRNQGLVWILIVATVAFYTRFEGILLFGAVLFSQILNKKFKELPITLLVTFLSVFPYFAKNYIVYGNFLKVGYLEDSSGFILNFKNLLKATGTFFFLTGGFYFLPILLIRLKEFKKINLKNASFISFLLFSFLLIFWGFYIRLYTVPLFFMFLVVIYGLENYSEVVTNKLVSYLFLIIGSSLFYLYQVQILDHLDLGENKYSKFFAILLSFTILICYFFYKKITQAKYLIILLIIMLNLSLFVFKFVDTREKYFTLVQASEFTIKNNLRVGYAEESGVSKWYLKDFDRKLNFLESNQTFEDWVKTNQIEYFIYTEELGFQDKKIKSKISEIKGYEKIAEFSSNFSGGKSVIFKIQ